MGEHYTLQQIVEKVDVLIKNNTIFTILDEHSGKSITLGKLQDMYHVYDQPGEEEYFGSESVSKMYEGHFYNGDRNFYVTTDNGIDVRVSASTETSEISENGYPYYKDDIDSDGKRIVTWWPNHLIAKSGGGQGGGAGKSKRRKRCKKGTRRNKKTKRCRKTSRK